MPTKYTHPKECADQKEAAADRKAHAATVDRRQRQLQLRAHAEWFDWYPPSFHNVWTRSSR
jgi:hypothetical protein